MARLGIEMLELGDHFPDVFEIHFAERLQCGEIALGDKIEIGDQGRHGRIEAVALAQLQRRGIPADRRRRRRWDQSPAAFRERAPTWSRLGAERVGDVGDIAGEIARLVHHADEVLADEAVGGVARY